MNCRQSHSLFDDRLDGRLAPDREAALADHLAACAGCRAEWQSYAAAWDTVGRLPAVEPSVGFAERTLRRLAEPEPGRARFPLWQPVWGRALVAAGLAAVAIAAWVGYQRARDARALALYAVVEPAESLNDLAVVASLHLLKEDAP